MKTQRFAVVRKDNGPNNPHTGIVSFHRTAEAAHAAIAKANRKLRKQPGYATAWHPYEVLDRFPDREFYKAFTPNKYGEYA